MASDGARRQLDKVEEGWSQFRAAVARLTPSEIERETLAGWTVKEMLAHVAFWEETVKPVFVGWFRGEPDDAFEGWYGVTTSA
ncbi:MAG: maleylpyruvate isomerase N-terminal domain-containing protein [Actinobacteria bacterium]|nr:maleylpyruvate isomerase N-terminal domain-containing protein [Actinomycetota bacterium]